MNIGGYLRSMLLKFANTSGELGRIKKVFLELCQFDGQQCEPLTDVVVKFSCDSAALLLLCLNQLAADTGQSCIRQLARSDVEKRDDCAHNLLPFPLGIAPVFSRETGAIRPP